MRSHMSFEGNVVSTTLGLLCYIGIVKFSYD